jgi:hypothetical protein
VLNGRQVQAMSSTIDKTEGPLRAFPSQVQRDRILNTAASSSPTTRDTGDPQMDATGVTACVPNFGSSTIWGIQKFA